MAARRLALDAPCVPPPAPAHSKNRTFSPSQCSYVQPCAARSTTEMGVSIVPAHTELTRILYLAKSYAQLRASCTIAPFIVALRVGETSGRAEETVLCEDE